MKVPIPIAQKDMYRIKRPNSRESGEGAGWRRAAKPATLPKAVKSPQQRTTPEITKKLTK